MYNCFGEKHFNRQFTLNHTSIYGNNKLHYILYYIPGNIFHAKNIRMSTQENK